VGSRFMGIKIDNAACGESVIVGFLRCLSTSLFVFRRRRRQRRCLSVVVVVGFVVADESDCVDEWVRGIVLIWGYAGWLGDRLLLAMQQTMTTDTPRNSKYSEMSWRERDGDCSDDIVFC
jgi:hypothetical protein